MEWLFAHMDDPDIDSPFVIPSNKKQSGGSSSSNTSQYEATAEMVLIR